MNADFTLSLPIKWGLEGLKFFHMGWWWYQKKKIYTNPDNFLTLAGGNLLNVTISNPLFRSTAKLLYIITSIDRCSKQTWLLNQDFHQLSVSIQNHYALCPKIKWSKQNKSSFFSVTVKNSWQIKKQKLAAAIGRICRNAYAIFMRLGKLSMHMWDTYDSFFDESQAMQEIFVNTSIWCEKIKNNKDYYIDLLTSKKQKISIILKKMGVHVEIDEFMNHAIDSINGAAKVITVVNYGKEVGNGILTDFFKRSTTNFFAAFNMLDWLPENTRASNKAEWYQKLSQKKTERYPNVQAMVNKIF